MAAKNYIYTNHPGYLTREKHEKQEKTVVSIVYLVQFLVAKNLATKCFFLKGSTYNNIMCD